MKRLVKVWLTALFLFALVFTAFGAGVLVGGAGLPAAAAEPPRFRTLGQVYDLVEERFVDREVLQDPVALEYAAVRGLIEALGDEGHTRFLTPEERVRQQTDLSGTFSGIGAMVGERDGLPVIVAPFEGSPADRAGVEAGDIIVEVDGQDVTALSLSEVVERIRGEEGTQVVLTVLRPDEDRNLEIPIVRGEITVPAVTWTMVPGTQVALIRFSRFSANANEEMVRALREAQEAGATGLVLDVRNNPGGLLDQAIRVTSQFLEDGNVLQQEDARGNRESFPVRSGGLATDIPLVVLVNQGSASSAEILAGALQDHARGPIVGETTFGTGTVLQPFNLEDGSGLLLGTSQWLTADGRLIRKQGIEPDVVVELPAGANLLGPGAVEGLTLDELLESDDLQLLKGLELLDALPQD
jgi:carboxyl-terminal processing protease